MNTNRFKNYGLWVSIFALLGLVLQNFGLFTKLGLTNETYNNLVSAVLAVLVGAGIISNPSIGAGYADVVPEVKVEDKVETTTEAKAVETPVVPVAETTAPITVETPKVEEAPVAETAPVTTTEATQEQK